VKICYLCTDRGISLAKQNGSAAHIRNMVRAFCDLGHDVELVMSETEGTQELGIPAHAIPLGELSKHLGSGVARSARGSLKAALKSYKRVNPALKHVWTNVHAEQVLTDVLRRFEPDLVYERYSPFGIAGGVMAAQASVPHILEVNAPLAWQGTKYRDQALKEAAEYLELIAYSTTGVIRAISEELREELISAGVPPSKIAVVPCGFDPVAFTPEGEVGRSPDFNGATVIGFVGSLKPWHGIEVLTEAFRRLAAKPGYHLLVVGDGPLIDVVTSLQEELPGRVTLARSVPHQEVPSLIRAMDITVAPYPGDEPFYFSPLKVLEYMAVGRAVVASRIGQISELINDGQSGVLLPPGDAAALAEAIRRLAADRPLRESLGVQAAAEVRNGHTWVQRASEIIDLARANIPQAPS
jgi:glycosyltransferase involved in cell wall biosynthesis